MPKTSPASAPPELLLQQRAPEALALLRRAQRRLWTQVLLQRLAVWLALPLAAAALIVAATRWVPLPQAWDPTVDLLTWLLSVAVAIWAVAHRTPLQKAARAVDEASAGSDTLATAVDLAAHQRRDGWAQVQAAYADRASQRLVLPQLLPMRLPQGWRPSAAAALALVAVVAAADPLDSLRMGQAQLASGLAVDLPPRPPGFESARQDLGEDATQLLSVDERLLGEIEEQLSDPQTRKWIGDLRQVVQAVQQGRIDKRQALEQLAALEAARPNKPELDAALQEAKAGASPGNSPDHDPAEAERQRDLAARKAVLDATQKALDAAPEGEDKKALEKALEQADLGMVAKALQKLAEKDLQPKDLEKWRKTLEKFADALKDAKVPKGMEELAKKISRLEKQRAEQGGLNPSDQRRLQEARRDLEQLRRENGDAEAARHQVQRLERQARQAADELRRVAEGESRLDKGKGAGQKGQQGQQGQQGGEKGGQKGESGGASQQAMREAMRQAADELRRQDEGQKSRQAQRIGESRMRDLREALSRGEGRKGQAGGEQPRGQDGGQGQDQRQADGKSRLKPGQKGERGQEQHNSGDNGEAGQGQAGQQGDQAGQDGEAGNRPGQKRSFRLGSKGLGDKSRTELIGEGYEQGRGQRSAKGQGQSGEGGSQAGTDRGSDQGQGKKIAMDAARTEKVQGQQGSGPDVKQTFMDAARKGFARQGWREVYAEYSQVAEEMLDKEGLPPGRKALVRRYFEKIRPR